jgi:hypothetical protein
LLFSHFFKKTPYLAVAAAFTGTVMRPETICDAKLCIPALMASCLWAKTSFKSPWEEKEIMKGDELARTVCFPLASLKKKLPDIVI